MPNFDALDARIASALNKIIPNSHSKEDSVWRNKKAQMQDRFFRGRQIAYLIYEYFRVTGVHDSVENYADLFTIALRNDDIQEFDSKWVGILLSMTKIPPDDFLEGLFNGQCVNGDNCSFRHDMDKLGKSYTMKIRLRILSCSRMSENHRETDLPEESPSGRTSRWPCKDYLKGTCNNSFRERWHPPDFLQDQEWLSVWGKVLIRTLSG